MSQKHFPSQSSIHYCERKRFFILIVKQIYICSEIIQKLGLVFLKENFRKNTIDQGTDFFIFLQKQINIFLRKCCISVFNNRFTNVIIKF